jgi:hypothetical protein
VLLPFGNKKDLVDLPKGVCDSVDIVIVERVDDVWEHALLGTSQEGPPLAPSPVVFERADSGAHPVVAARRRDAPADRSGEGQVPARREDRRRGPLPRLQRVQRDGE